jgi:DNA-binding response OmpR family regulator
MQKSLGNRYTITLDDDPSVFRIIEKSTGFKSHSFSSPEELLCKASKYEPVAAFIDIDLGLGHCRGLEVIPSLRKYWPFCAILVITSDTTDAALSNALALGADDFIRKPIHPPELLARLESRVQELADKEINHVLRMADITFHVSRRSVKGSHGSTYLSPTAATILAALIRAKGTVIRREKLQHQVWGDLKVTDNALDRKIYELRKALLEVSDQLEIKSIYGVGFGLGPVAKPVEAA